MVQPSSPFLALMAAVLSASLGLTAPSKWAAYALIFTPEAPAVSVEDAETGDVDDLGAGEALIFSAARLTISSDLATRLFEVVPSSVGTDCHIFSSRGPPRRAAVLPA